MQPDLDYKSTSLRSLDAYRGFIMLAMASGNAAGLAGFVDHGNNVSSPDGVAPTAPRVSL
jgi:hypothetical protein